VEAELFTGIAYPTESNDRLSIRGSLACSQTIVFILSMPMIFMHYLMSVD
jgi:hypothetical protein